jgi:hypothetical protein
MDEGYSVWFASHKSIGSFFSTLLGSNSHFYIFAGYLPWLLIGVTATLAVSYALLRTSPDKVSATARD